MGRVTQNPPLRAKLRNVGISSLLKKPALRMTRHATCWVSCCPPHPDPNGEAQNLVGRISSRRLETLRVHQNYLSPRDWNEGLHVWTPRTFIGNHSIRHRPPGRRMRNQARKIGPADITCSRQSNASNVSTDCWGTGNSSVEPNRNSTLTPSASELRARASLVCLMPAGLISTVADVVDLAKLVE
jgi:hypothetical protein